MSELVLLLGPLPFVVLTAAWEEFLLDLPKRDMRLPRDLDSDEPFFDSFWLPDALLLPLPIMEEWS